MMISLVPIDQTVAGKQIYGRGYDKGKLIGAIRTAQRFLELPVSSEDELAKKNREELSLLLTSLETDGGEGTLSDREVPQKAPRLGNPLNLSRQGFS